MSRTDAPDDKSRQFTRTDAEWRAALDAMQYQVARQAAIDFAPKP